MTDIDVIPEFGYCAFLQLLHTIYYSTLIAYYSINFLVL